jgi:hypothetical protein
VSKKKINKLAGKDSVAELVARLLYIARVHGYNLGAEIFHAAIFVL